MLRVAPGLAIAILLGPVAFGLLATLLPAFGYFPALGGEMFSLAPFRQLFAQPGLFRSAAISFFTGLGTTAVALTIVALFVAGWSGTRVFARLQHLLSPLLSVPHAAAAFGLAFLIAPSGWIMRLFSPWATGITRPPDWLIVNDPMGLSMMAGLVAKEIPFLFLVTLAALPQVQPNRHMHVATALGYGRVAGFLFAVWPRVYRQIRLAVFAVIAYATSVVDVAAILGPAAPPALALRLVGWMNDPELSMKFMASAGALLQLAVTALALLAWLAMERAAGSAMRALRATGRRFQRDGSVRQAALGATAVFALSIFAGLAVLAIWSFAGFWAFPDALPRGFSLATWKRAVPGLVDPLAVTMIIGIGATLAAVVLALACLEREARTGRSGGDRALLFVYIPLLVPQAGFVFGLQLFFLMIGWDASWTALALVHLIFVLPYVFLSLSDPWRAWDRRYASIAHGLGASENRTFWRIRLPMLLRAIFTAAAVGFAVSVGQYLPTVLIGSGRLTTITTEAVALASGGDRRVIGVYAFLQMLLPFVIFALAAAVPALLFRKRRDMKAA